jgi:hypothetical protein
LKETRDEAGGFSNAVSTLREERRKMVDRAQNFDEVFELVKRIVYEELGEHRAGLSLVLANLSREVGAYYPVGANTIVVNKSLIEGLLRVTKNPKEVNAFIFTILLHEYLHSLGYLDERKVRSMSQMLCKDNLGSDHPTVRLADANWLEMYPELNGLIHPGATEFEVVNKFDSSSTGYIG